MLPLLLLHVVHCRPGSTCAWINIKPSPTVAAGSCKLPMLRARQITRHAPPMVHSSAAAAAAARLLHCQCCCLCWFSCCAGCRVRRAAVKISTPDPAWPSCILMLQLMVTAVDHCAVDHCTTCAALLPWLHESCCHNLTRTLCSNSLFALLLHSSSFDNRPANITLVQLLQRLPQRLTRLPRAPCFS